MKASLRAATIGLVFCTLAVAIIGGCPGWPFYQPARPTTTGDASLQRITSGDELLNYFKQQVTASTRRATGSFFDLLVPAAGGASNGAVETADTGGEQTTSFSTTNVQETGVDESDVFKSDGTNFYIAQNDTLRILRATPTSEMRELGQLKFDDPIHSLYLFGDKVIVLLEKNNFVLMTGVAPTIRGGGAEDTSTPMMWPPYDVRATVSVAAVDVSDPANPAVAARNDLDGVLVSSRLTNGHLVLVLTYEPPLPAVQTPLAIAGMALNDVLPKMDTGQGAEVLVPPGDWYRPLSPDGYFATMVVTLDAADVKTVVGSTAVMAGAGTIYSSTDALYLTDTTYDENDSFRESTAIHKLRYNEEGVAEYVASGTVPGRLLNQFSLSEFEGNLRVATHVDDVRFFGGPILLGDGAIGVAVADAGTSSSDATTTTQAAQTAAGVPTGPYNAVYVVAPNADKLNVIGRLENIAPGEQLYAARFLDKHAFLVTFRQIDPLFVLDLTDPNNPQSVGELKIPGYSDYLHPYGDNLLIGVGRSTETSPWGGVVRSGLQLSLFDVSDWTNPTLIEQLDLGGYNSESDVSVTHKAFTFLPDQGLLAIPAVLYPTDYDPYINSVYVGPSFDGALVYQVSPAGFEAKGRVSSVVYTDAYGMTYVQWRRAAFIGQTAYAITSDGVRAAPLADMNTTTTVTLPSETP